MPSLSWFAWGLRHARDMPDVPESFYLMRLPWMRLGLIEALVYLRHLFDPAKTLRVLHLEQLIIRPVQVVR